METKKYRVIIAEDHAIVRDGLKALLVTEPDLEIVGEIEDGIKAVRSVAKLQPDLILMDLSMPRMNGLEATHEIRNSDPNVKILILTVHKNDEHILAALKAGANGYVLKEAKHSELIMAIRHVLEGKYYLSPGVSEIIVGGYLDGQRKSASRSTWDTLTKREREITKLIAEGYKNKEIADHLCISVKTVEKHRANLMRKLNLHNAVELTVFAVKKGLISE
ncbi:response regulator [Thermodesulfobacteriota bacterium]